MEFSVAEDILQPLIRASKSSNLKGALQILVETCRNEDGRADLASKDVLPSVLKLLQSIPCPSPSPCGHQYVTLSLKLLRNLCAGEITNQTLFVTFNGPQILSTFFRDPVDHGIIRFALQVLANVSLAGVEHQLSIWRCFFPRVFLELAKVRNQATCDPLCMILYATCDGNPSLLLELCGDQGLTIVAEILRTASIDGYGENWFKLLLSRICFEQVYFRQLFSFLSCVGDSDNTNSEGIIISSSGDVFSTEQAYLLRTVSDILNERLEEMSVSIDFALYVFGIFKRCIRIADFVSRGNAGLPTGFAAVDVLGHSLSIFRDICAQHRKVGLDDDSEDVVGTLLSCGLLELLFSVLCNLEPPSIIKKAMKQNENQKAVSSHSYKPCPYKGFRRDIVAVIGNCAFRRKDVQDELRKKNRILLLLQQCVTDEDNPFLREWGIWCVRNLLEGNVENQKAVAELELQGTVEVPELSGLGLRVEVDPNTRRARLVNVSSTHDTDASLGN